MVKGLSLLSGKEVVKFQNKPWFKDEVFKLVNDRGVASYLVPDNRLDEEPSLIDKLIEGFEWEKVRSVMFKLNWTWYGREDPPTIEEMQEMVRSLYSSIALRVSCNEYAYAATGGFKLTYNPDEDKELSLVFEAVSYSVFDDD